MRAARGGRAAGLVLVATWAMATSGRAEDLPRPASEGMRLGVCGAAGGFPLPGTAACLRIGGIIAAEGAWRIAAPPTAALASPTNGASRAVVLSNRLDRSGLGVGARLTADMRMPTELGPVRVYVSLRGRNGVATDRAAR